MLEVLCGLHDQPGHGDSHAAQAATGESETDESEVALSTAATAAAAGRNSPTVLFEINRRQCEGATAFFLAAQESYLDCMELLAQCKADVSERSVVVRFVSFRFEKPNPTKPNQAGKNGSKLRVALCLKSSPLCACLLSAFCFAFGFAFAFGSAFCFAFLLVAACA